MDETAHVGRVGVPDSKEQLREEKTMLRRRGLCAAVILLMPALLAGAEPQAYRNFKVTIFIPV